MFRQNETTKTHKPPLCPRNTTVWCCLLFYTRISSYLWVIGILSCVYINLVLLRGKKRIMYFGYSCMSTNYGLLCFGDFSVSNVNSLSWDSIEWSSLVSFCQSCLTQKIKNATLQMHLKAAKEFLKEYKFSSNHQILSMMSHIPVYDMWGYGNQGFVH